MYNVTVYRKLKRAIVEPGNHVIKCVSRVDLELNRSVLRITSGDATVTLNNVDVLDYVGHEEAVTIASGGRLVPNLYLSLARTRRTPDDDVLQLYVDNSRVITASAQRVLLG